MRVKQQVISLFGNKDFIKKANMLSQMKGGWERWFQMELAYYIAINFPLYNIKLEDKTVYPQTALRADLTLTRRSTTVVELKCQVAGSSTDDFQNLIEGDIAKVSKLDWDDDYQVIALVQDKDDVEYLYQRLVQKYPDEITRYIFPENLLSPKGFVCFYRAGKPDMPPPGFT